MNINERIKLAVTTALILLIALFGIGLTQKAVQQNQKQYNNLTYQLNYSHDEIARHYMLICSAKLPGGFKK